MTIFNPLLSKVVSKLNDRPVLKYVYQNQKNGEFVASDGQIMLIERNGSIPMFEFWHPETQEPFLTSDGLTYPDYEKTLSDAEKTADKYTYNVSFNVDFVIVDNRYVIKRSDYNLILDFIGNSPKIDIPSYGYTPLIFSNLNKQKQAVILPLKVYPKDLYKKFWDVIDYDGIILATFNTFAEAEQFKILTCGIVRMRED